jgi:hypothetical protein
VEVFQLHVVAVAGDRGGDLGVEPAVASFTHRITDATWRLASKFGADRVTLELKSGGASGVTDLAGNALDGEWVNGVSPFPSGNGMAGGDFVFRFNVLPGDVTRSGSINSIDLALLRRRVGTSAGPGAAPAGYSVFYDLDGNGSVGALDLLIARRNERRALPQPLPLA